MRDNDLLLKEGSHQKDMINDHRMSTEEAVKIIMEACDRRARKVQILIYLRSSSH